MIVLPSMTRRRNPPPCFSDIPFADAIDRLTLDCSNKHAHGRKKQGSRSARLRAGFVPLFVGMTSAVGREPKSSDVRYLVAISGG
jgi:hypothetical protein